MRKVWRFLGPSILRIDAEAPGRDGPGQCTKSEICKEQESFKFHGSQGYPEIYHYDSAGGPALPSGAARGCGKQ
jgi:hypothetical protein